MRKNRLGLTRLEGLFDFIYIAVIRFTATPFVVLLRLVEGIGKYRISAEVRDLERNNRSTARSAAMPSIMRSFGEGAGSAAS
jgi:hypothetical protein